jgi:MFS family permease
MRSLRHVATSYEVLFLTALIWFLAKFLRYAFPPLFEVLQGTYGVSNTVLGTAFTGFMLAYAAMQFPSGLFADRLGSVVVITAGASLTAVAALVLVVDSPFVVVVVAMLLMGVGTGMHKTVAVRLLSRAYPDHTGRTLGIQDTVGVFGGIAAPAAVVFVLGVSGGPVTEWRLLFLAAALVGFALAGAFVIRVPSRVPSDARKRATDPDEHGGIGRYVALFREWQFSTFVLMTLLFSFAYNGVVAFLPVYLIDEAGVPTATASLLYALLFAAGPVQIVTGEASDRIGIASILVGTLTVAAVSLAALVSFSPTGNTWLLGIAVVCIGIGAHGHRPIRGAYLLSVVPVSIAGGSLGVVRTLLMGAGALAPAAVGILSDMAGFRSAFWLLTASMGGAAGLAVLLWFAGE